MVYIEKNDKPTFIEKIFLKIKIQKNTIIVPIEENMEEKNIEKIAQKTQKIIKKLSNSKKIIVSRNIKKNSRYIRYLNSYGMDISDGRWLFNILLVDIIDFIVKKQEMKKVNISVLINDLNDIEFQNIKLLAQKYSTINIVTNHINKFKKLENDLQKEGIIVTITNNKKKSLMKSQIIINIDFPKEMFNKYRVNESATIVNVKRPMKIMQKRFEGITVNDYEINFNSEVCDEKFFDKKYDMKDLYEASIYKKSPFIDLRRKIKNDNVSISKLFLNNGELEQI